MFTIGNLARFICILISLFGASVFIKKRAGIAYAFCMSIACSLIVSILFLTSLFMRITAVIWILFGVGILMFVYELIRLEIHKEDILNWTNLFLLIGLVVLFIFLAGRRFIFIDDYTHWGVIARHLVENQTLPNSSNYLITFPSYAPGSALWIAYVVTLCGGATEDLYLIAQAFLILVFFAPLTGCTFQKPNAKMLSVCMLITAMALCAVSMTFSTTVISLCVDGLLAASALSGIFFLILSDCSLRAKAWFLIPLMLTVMLIKAAGILFAASEFVILLYLVIREKKRGTVSDKGGELSGKRGELSEKRGAAVAGLIAGPVLCIVVQLLWSWHVRVAFPDASSTMHAVSIARWKEVYATRGPEVVQMILKGFFHKITLWYLVLFVVALIVIYVIVFICGRKAGHRIARQSLWLLLLSLIHYVVYLASLLFVYLFSMDAIEASYLAAFDRYMWVELIFLAGLCICFLFRLFSRYVEGFEKAPSDAYRSGAIRLVPMAVMTVAMVVFVLFLWLSGPRYEGLDYPSSTICQINDLAPKDYAGDILIYAPSQMDAAYDESLLLFFSRYKFRTPDAHVATFDRGNVELFMAQHTHIFISEPDAQLVSYLRDQGWTCDIVPGLYDIAQKSLVE